MSKTFLTLTALLLAPLTGTPATAADTGSTFAQIAQPHPRSARKPGSAETGVSVQLLDSLNPSPLMPCIALAQWHPLFSSRTPLSNFVSGISCMDPSSIP
jgi:hypothetical protein